jgi:hypothetical protein
MRQNVCQEFLGIRIEPFKNSKPWEGPGGISILTFPKASIWKINIIQNLGFILFIANWNVAWRQDFQKSRVQEVTLA